MPESPLALAESVALKERPGERCELSEGNLIVNPSASFDHNALRDELSARLRFHARARGLGWTTADTDFLLGHATIRRPDVAFLLRGRMRPEWRRVVPIPVPPDLVFEIIGAGDRADDLLLKVRQYLRAGAFAVWLLYPGLREAHRHSHSASSAELRCAERGEAIQEPEMLPDLLIPLEELFAAAAE